MKKHYIAAHFGRVDEGVIVRHGAYCEVEDSVYNAPRDVARASVIIFSDFYDLHISYETYERLDMRDVLSYI